MLVLFSKVHIQPPAKVPQAQQPMPSMMNGRQSSLPNDKMQLQQQYLQSNGRIQPVKPAKLLLESSSMMQDHHQPLAPLAPLAPLQRLLPQQSTMSTPQVQDILKFMTSTVDPLPGIPATPRNEIMEIKPTRAHIYAELPPTFKSSMKPRKCHLNFFLMNLV